MRRRRNPDRPRDADRQQPAPPGGANRRRAALHDAGEHPRLRARATRGERRGRRDPATTRRALPHRWPIGSRKIAARSRTSIWLALEREHDNFRAALNWLAAHGEPDVFVQMTYGLALFWEVRGHLAESRKWCDVELTLAPRLPPAMEARAWLHDASLAWHDRRVRTNENIGDTRAGALPRGRRPVPRGAVLSTLNRSAPESRGTSPTRARSPKRPGRSTWRSAIGEARR